MVTATFASSLISTTRMINWIHGYSSNHRSSAQPTALTSLPKHLSFMAGSNRMLLGLKFERCVSRKMAATVRTSSYEGSEMKEAK
ncbi:hypothetical protein WN943_015862 [Citrus x changshan-huyou]